jgi:large conductance mechanosensitive channel
VVSKIIKAAESRFGSVPGAPATKECPQCLEMIPAKATRCRACTSILA